MNNEITYSPLAFNEVFKASLEENILSIRTNTDAHLKAKFELTQNEATLTVLDHNAEDLLGRLMLVGLEHLFGSHRELHRISISSELTEYPFNYLGSDISRSDFFQIPLLWTAPKDLVLKPERWTETKGVQHPVRERLAEGLLYKKYVPQIGKNLTLRLLSENDLEIFHQWHNQPRVSHFWELNKDKNELLSYIQNGLKDPHQFPIMVELDNEPVGYYEFYWVKEDRLGPYYESEAYDRGFHFLIGNKNFLGFKTTDALIKTVLHFLFLDDPRTRKVMAEPRSDNQKVLKYAESAIGWKKLKEFDFPHKRAALLECRRELFFGGHAL